MGIVGSMMAVGCMMASMLGGSTMKIKYDEISDATKSAILLCPMVMDTFKIPMPYGYGFSTMPVVCF